MMARPARPPRGPRRRARKTISAAAQRGIAAAISVLQSIRDSGAPGLSEEEYQAERERLRIEAEASRHRQGCFTLKVTG